jgi:AraC family transcriptional regulator
MGSPRFRTSDAGSFAFTDAWFPAGAYLQPHVHDRPCFAVILSGSLDVAFRSAAFYCEPASVHTEPQAERHANRIGRRGAHVLVIQPDPLRERLVVPLRGILDRTTQRRHAGIAELAARLVAELDGGDTVAPLAQEGLALEMLALAARTQSGDESGRVPRWLLTVQEYLHAHRFESLRIGSLAAELDLPPTRLARAFRRHFHVSIGAYVRRLRIEWAAAALSEDDSPLSAIAVHAGFVDQSHFTRVFTRLMGVSPGRYRDGRADRPARRVPPRA